MFSSLFILVILFLLGLSNADHILSPKGRRIPLAILRDHLPGHDHAFLRSSLVEIDNNLTMHTHNGTFKIDVTTMTTSYVIPHLDQVVFIDGIQQNASSQPISVQKGSGAVVVRNHAGSVRFLTTSSSNYVALDENVHPGVFIDTLSMKRRKNTLKYQPTKLQNSRIRRIPLVLPSEVRQSRPQVACNRKSPKRIVELAIVADSDTCKEYGRTAAAVKDKITFLLAEAQTTFTAISCLELRTVRLDIFCDRTTDPYKNQRVDKESKALQVFMDTFNTDVERHDIALYLAPKYPGDDSLGTAIGYVGCHDDAYSWSDAALDDFSMYTTIAHEIGHNIGLQHSKYGIMRGDGFAASRFSRLSAESLRAFMRTASASCIARDGREREMNARFGPRCSCSTRKTQNFKYKRVGSLPGPVVDGVRVKIPVEVRMYNGRIFVHVITPRSVDEHEEHGRIDFTLGLTYAVVEYEKSGGIAREAWSGNGDATMEFQEKYLMRPAGSRSCCERQMTVNVQTSIEAYDWNNNEIIDYTTWAIGTVRLAVKCQ